MKFILPTLLLALMAFTGCDKSDDNRPSGILPSSEYVWVRSTGGIGGWTITPNSEGYRELLTIQDNRFLLTRDGEVTMDFTFTLELEVEQSPAPGGSAYDIYRLVNDEFPEQFVYYFHQFEEGYFFDEGCCDRYTHEFRR